MAIKLSPTGPVGGDYADPNALVYALAKLLFGADANGVVTLPADLTSDGYNKADPTFAGNIANAV